MIPALKLTVVDTWSRTPSSYRLREQPLLYSCRVHVSSCFQSSTQLISVVSQLYFLLKADMNMSRIDSDIFFSF